jgi:hypothetical protein
MTTSSKEETTVESAPAANRADVSKHDALWNFQFRRKILVHNILSRGDYSLGASLSRYMLLSRHIDEFSKFETYSFLFPVDLPVDDRTSMLRELFTVATMLLTDVERAAGSSVEMVVTGNTVTTAEKYANIQNTGEDAAVLSAKVAAAETCFEGVVALQALALMCGYDAATVSALTADEVTRVFGLIAGCGVQLPWSVIEGYLAEDIDLSLMESLMTDRDSVLAVSRA